MHKERCLSVVLTIIDFIVRFSFGVVIALVGSLIIDYINADIWIVMVIGFWCISPSVYIMRQSKLSKLMFKVLK